MRPFRCNDCGEIKQHATRSGPLPARCDDCDPVRARANDLRRETQREAARQRRLELEALRLEVRELRRDGGLTDSERRRLALVTDLLAAWARWSGGGERVPDDEAIAELALQACRAGVQSSLGRTRSIELAGAALARALATHEVIAERNTRAAASRAA
jgi:hypothetical protein